MFDIPSFLNVNATLSISCLASSNVYGEPRLEDSSGVHNLSKKFVRVLGAPITRTSDIVTGEVLLLEIYPVSFRPPQPSAETYETRQPLRLLIMLSLYPSIQLLFSLIDLLLLRLELELVEKLL